MTETTIRLNLNQTLDIQADLSAKLTFNGMFLFEYFSDLSNLLIVQITCFHAWIKIERSANCARGGKTNPINGC